MFFKKKKSVTKMDISEFAHANKDLLIIVCDPKTDNIFVGYKDKVVSARMKTADGKRMRVVKNVLIHSQFKKHVDPFLHGIAQALQLPFTKGNQFYQFLDGALFNISKALRKDKPQKGAVPSPFMESKGSGRN